MAEKTEARADGEPSDAPQDDRCELGNQGRAVPELLMHRVLPLRGEPWRAPSDRRPLPCVDGDCD